MNALIAWRSDRFVLGVLPMTHSSRMCWLLRILEVLCVKQSAQVVQFHLFHLAVNFDRMLLNNGACDLLGKNSAAKGVVTWRAWQERDVGLSCADFARPKRSKEDFAHWLFGAFIYAHCLAAMSRRPDSRDHGM